MSTASVIFNVLVGVGLVSMSLFPFPSWPNLLSPQQDIELSDCRAQVCAEPDDIVTASLIPDTGTGELESAVVPFPRRP